MDDLGEREIERERERDRARASKFQLLLKNKSTCRAISHLCARTRCLSFVCEAVLSHIPVCMQAHIACRHIHTCILHILIGIEGGEESVSCVLG